MRGVNGLAALKTLSFSGGCNLGVQRAWEPEHKGMTAAPRKITLLKLHYRDRSGVPNL